MDKHHTFCIVEFEMTLEKPKTKEHQKCTTVDQL